MDITVIIGLFGALSKMLEKGNVDEAKEVIYEVYNAAKNGKTEQKPAE